MQFIKKNQTKNFIFSLTVLKSSHVMTHRQEKYRPGNWVIVFLLCVRYFVKIGIQIAYLSFWRVIERLVWLIWIIAKKKKTGNYIIFKYFFFQLNACFQIVSNTNSILKQVLQAVIDFEDTCEYRYHRSEKSPLSAPTDKKERSEKQHVTEKKNRRIYLNKNRETYFTSLAKGISC